MIAKQITFLLVFLLGSSFFLSSNLTSKVVAAAQTSPDLYFGVDVAYESVALTEQLIDNVSSYTNIFVIGCYGNYNESRLNVISQYVFDKGLSFIVYTDDPRYPSAQWFTDSKSKWGDKFIGIYFYDEPGGKQLDQAKYPPVPLSPGNYSSFASDFVRSEYVNTLSFWLRTGPYAMTKNFAFPNEYPFFTSDYGLYWYDYQGGYDTVFAEFGIRIGNASYARQLNVALDRGAATAMNKDWGVMITWASYSPPYMENGTDLYADMTFAYENGAKYILVFDSNENYTQSVLYQDHFDAMKQFWQFTQDNPRNTIQISERTAYVLPDSFGYGFRNPNADTIWGLWRPDSTPELYNLTLDISMSVAALLIMIGPDLDIVYPDQLQSVQSAGYHNVVFWNDPSLIQDAGPKPSSDQLLFFSLYVLIAATAVLVVTTFTIAALRSKRKLMNKKLTEPVQTVGDLLSQKTKTI